MKKVVHIVLRDYVDGYSYQENLLPQKQAELGFDVYVLASQRYRDINNRKAFHEVADFTNKYGVKVSILPCKSKNNFTGFFVDQVYGLYERLETITPDIIFVHGFCYRDMRQIVKYVNKHQQVRVYADCHTDYYNSQYDTLYGKAKALFAKRQGHILNRVALKFWGTTPWRVDFLKNVYKLPSRKIDLLILGADEKLIENLDRMETRTEIRRKYGIPSDAFLVITGGKLDRRKQQDLLMEAVRKMESDNVWLMAFGAPSEEMRPIFQQYVGTKNIVMTGWMASEDTYPLFMASDLAFFPGTHSVLWEEAVACSTPIVVKHWDGMEHVNVNGNALMMDVVSVDEIISTIHGLIHTSSYQSMLDKAAKCASSFYLRSIALKAIDEQERC